MTYLYLLLGISFAISAFRLGVFHLFLQYRLRLCHLGTISGSGRHVPRCHHVAGTAIVCGAVRLWHKVGTLLAIEREALSIV